MYVFRETLIYFLYINFTMNNWYPDNKKELLKTIKIYLKKPNNKKIHGLIVPHAGYIYSGNIAGKVYSYLENKKFDNVIIFGPSHYASYYGLASLDELKTPLGKVNIEKNDLRKLKYEHSIENQIPFLQYFGIKKVLPIVVGDITLDQAKDYAKEFNKKNTLYIFSTDLSHFLNYKDALKKDKETIKIIENLNLEKFGKIDACGRNALKILFHICKENKWKPKLIDYKNSGDITKDKKSVVGYASFWF